MFCQENSHLERSFGVGIQLGGGSSFHFTYEQSDPLAQPSQTHLPLLQTPANEQSQSVLQLLAALALPQPLPQLAVGKVPYPFTHTPRSPPSGSHPKPPFCGGAGGAGGAGGVGGDGEHVAPGAHPEV